MMAVSQYITFWLQEL